MSRPLGLMLGLALALCACPRTDRQVPAPGPDQAAIPPGPDAASGAAPESAGPGPAAEAGLGEPCPGGEAAGVERERLDVFCDGAGKVSGVVMPVDVLHGVPPPGAEVLVEHPDTRGIPGVSLSVAVEGERLWVRRVTCSRCRRVLGWSFVGDLPRMRPEDLAKVQVRLGLPAEPALRDSRAWREACRGLGPERVPAGRQPWDE